jgi:hypothetical protein
MSKRETIEFAIIGGICAICEVFALGGFIVALIITGAIPWL